jgi:adenosylcobinamide kinase/adenosylcobinamide-phosphate guanylyltransferase
VTFIATAAPEDDEMRRRIARHRQSRPSSWTTVEELLAVPAVVNAHAAESSFVVIDCLTIWLSNLLFEHRERDPVALEATIRESAAQLIQASKLGNIIAVTNEVGSGIVPESPLSRMFRDLQGLLNQQIAYAADSVYLLVCGIPTRIKPMGDVPAFQP